MYHRPLFPAVAVLRCSSIAPGGSWPQASSLSEVLVETMRYGPAAKPCPHHIRAPRRSQDEWPGRRKSIALPLEAATASRWGSGAGNSCPGVLAPTGPPADSSDAPERAGSECLIGHGTNRAAAPPGGGVRPVRRPPPGRRRDVRPFRRSTGPTTRSGHTDWSDRCRGRPNLQPNHDRSSLSPVGGSRHDHVGPSVRPMLGSTVVAHSGMPSLEFPSDTQPGG